MLRVWDLSPVGVKDHLGTGNEDERIVVAAVTATLASDCEPYPLSRRAPTPEVSLSRCIGSRDFADWPPSSKAWVQRVPGRQSVSGASQRFATRLTESPSACSPSPTLLG